jgi:hypothetical protein
MPRNISKQFLAFCYHLSLEEMDDLLTSIGVNPKESRIPDIWLDTVLNALYEATKTKLSIAEHEENNAE